jgi:antitoxin component YwqK of YwqJK toxin-antitoxin module
MNGHFKSNLQNGNWQYWYPNGQLYYEGEFELGKKQGIWTFNYNDGKLWKKGEYINDKKNRLWVSQYENGNKAFEGSYKDDFENSEWSSWYENGQLKDKGTYSLGLMNAFWEGWYPNAVKKYEGYYEKDLKMGSWKYWTDRSILKDEESYKIFQKNGLSSNRELFQSYKHGSFKSYDEKQGKLVSAGSYNKGMQNGLWKYFYPGGVISHRELNYKEGKLDGSSKEFSRKGELKSEINYIPEDANSLTIEEYKYEHSSNRETEPEKKFGSQVG